jgi:hypothetical protein
LLQISAFSVQRSALRSRHLRIVPAETSKSPRTLA